MNMYRKCPLHYTELIWSYMEFVCFIIYYRPEHQDIINGAFAYNISVVRPIFDSVVDWSEDSYRLFETIGLTGLQVHACSSSVDQVSIATYIYIYKYI